MMVHGIFDSTTQILTVSNRSFRIRGVSELDTAERLEKITTWARKNMLLSQNGVIAEL